MSSRRRTAIAALVVGLTIGGCAGGDPSGAPPAPSAPGTVDSTASPVTTRSPAPKKTTRTRKSSALVEWIKEFAPTGGGGSPEEAAYTWFMKGDCETVLAIARDTSGETGPMTKAHRVLYEGAAAACLAAFHQRSDLWSLAVARHDGVDTRGMSCWHRSVYRIFTTIVEAYRDNPDVRFGRAGGTGRSECPMLSGLRPDHGSRAGGYRVEVRGSNLPRSMDLILITDDGVTVSATTADGRLTFVMPPYRESPTFVVLKIADAPRIESVYAQFEFDG